MPILKTHNPETATRRSDPYRAIYQSARWHRYSRGFRKKYPLCAECLRANITKIAQCVDHITPIAEGGDVWDLNNLQSLCQKCHSKKTVSENKHWNA